MIEKSSLLFQITHQFLCKNVDLKVLHHTGSKWFINGHKHRKENQLQSLNLLMLIMLNLVCKSDIQEAHNVQIYAYHI